MRNKMTELAPDLQFMLMVYEHEQRNEPIWFSKLVEKLKPGITMIEASKLMDKLMDLGLLDGKYEKAEGKWTYCFHISNEAVYLLEAVRK